MGLGMPQSVVEDGLQRGDIEIPSSLAWLLDECDDEEEWDLTLGRQRCAVCGEWFQPEPKQPVTDYCSVSCYHGDTQ